MDPTGEHQRETVDGFASAVDGVLRSLRQGEVVTYGEVAAEAGRPGAARAVGRFLATSDGEYPWWRVVAASGRLAPGKEHDQATRLAAEGVAVSDGRVVAVAAARRRKAAPDAARRVGGAEQSRHSGR